MMAEEIYHFVNGKLVLQPGTKRDPKRRYKTEISAGWPDRIVEMTPEEEAEDDRRQAELEENREREKPAREARERRREEQARALRESLVYKSRLVAFLDILGWKDAVKKSENDDAQVQRLGVGLSAISRAAEIQNTFTSRVPPRNIKVSQFSDCVLVSGPLDYGGLSELGSCIQHLIWLAFKEGLLLRGAITHGELIHEDSMVYGPGMIKAYKMESEEALYPRVILDPAVISSIRKNGFDSDKDQHHFGTCTFRRQREVDDLFFLDFLRPYLPPTADNPDALKWFKQKMAKTSTLVGEALESISNESVRKKYEWLAMYHDDTAKKYPESGVELLSIPFSPNSSE